MRGVPQLGAELSLPLLQPPQVRRGKVSPRPGGLGLVTEEHFPAGQGWTRHARLNKQDYGRSSRPQQHPHVQIPLPSCPVPGHGSPAAHPRPGENVLARRAPRRYSQMLFICPRKRCSFTPALHHGGPPGPPQTTPPQNPERAENRPQPVSMVA